MSIIETRELDPRDGFDLRVELHADPSNPFDTDAYGADDIAAYERGDWEYVGVVVVASRAGVDLGSDSIWGTEYGDLSGVTADPYYAVDYYDLPEGALEQARTTVTAICDGIGPEVETK